MSGPRKRYPTDPGERMPASDSSPELESAVPRSGPERRDEIALFLGLTAALSLPFWVLPFLQPDLVESAPGLFSSLFMWTPGSAALATRWIRCRTLSGLGWRWPGAKWLLVAYLAPLLYGLPYVVVWMVDEDAFALERATSAMERFGLGGLPPALALVLLALLLPALGLLVDSVTALGEEIGWRGLLVPSLCRRVGFYRASLISGGLWAAWHVPLIVVFVPSLQPGPPVAAAVAFFTVSLVGVSFLYAWLRLHTDSLWPAVVLHAATNLTVQGYFDRLTEDTGRTWWILGEHGAGVASVSVLIGVVCATTSRGAYR